jgi:hypothetical protein
MTPPNYMSSPPLRLETFSAGLFRPMLMCTTDLLYKENIAQEVEISRE